MIDRLDDRTSEALEAVEKLTGDVQDGLGDLPAWQLLQLRGWLGNMRKALDRLDYAIAAALPLTELDDQIAEHESAEHLRAERERVARARAAKS